MVNQFETFKELTDEAIAYLKSLSYGSTSIYTYSQVWRNLGRYMKKHEVQHYNASVGMQYLTESVGDIDCKFLTRWQRNRIRIISVLSDYKEFGAIRKSKKRTRPIKLEGQVGKAMSEYITYSKRASGLAEETVRSYNLYLSVFLSYLNGCGISSFDKFNQKLLIDFTGSLGAYSVITSHLIILKTNQFLRYICENKILPVDYILAIPKGKYVTQPKLPSYYAPEEITQLIKSIDRANPNGKRDYAMILLVARLGLRCSDIANLKFDNILWERELIALSQKKTREKIELPLLQEVGDAIIDYLKYGRPESNLPYIFLRQIPPYTNMDDNNLYGIIKKYLNRSGIKYDERRHGPHALRHSLATRLLAKEASLPLISNILGHTTTESTMTYLRVDVNSLRKCALEVSPVINDIYTKTGKEADK